ncbi:hypothetical protein DFH09DRAFT_1088878 [Mycena vulgaris]|nr:hypothetical protein DFH09DRAFT_1088878 [Mycena vulgaris]
MHLATYVLYTVNLLEKQTWHGTRKERAQHITLDTCKEERVTARHSGREAGRVLVAPAPCSTSHVQSPVTFLHESRRSHRDEWPSRRTQDPRWPEKLSLPPNNLPVSSLIKFQLPPQRKSTVYSDPTDYLLELPPTLTTFNATEIVVPPSVVVKALGRAHARNWQVVRAPWCFELNAPNLGGTTTEDGDHILGLGDEEVVAGGEERVVLHGGLAFLEPGVVFGAELPASRTRAEPRKTQNERIMWRIKSAKFKVRDRNGCHSIGVPVIREKVCWGCWVFSARTWLELIIKSQIVMEKATVGVDLTPVEGVGYLQHHVMLVNCPDTKCTGLEKRVILRAPRDSHQATSI